MQEFSRIRKRHTFTLALLLLSLDSLALAQKPIRNNTRPAVCDEYERTPVPAAELPTAQERAALTSCDSEELYFGFDKPADPAMARKCAYLEREKHAAESVFSGSALLTMIYANGNGAVRNFDLALKFACEVDGAPAENEGRIDHLSKLKSDHWAGNDFHFCDDITSGYMMGECTYLQEQFDKAARNRQFAKVIAGWSPVNKAALAELQTTAKVYFDASAHNEVDLTGTARGMFQVEAKAALDKKFLEAVQKFERGELPKFTTADFSKADAELNVVYTTIQSQKERPGMAGSITPEGVKTAQRAWLKYREAWVKFGKVKYPNITAESWRTWLTRERIKALRRLEVN